MVVDFEIFKATGKQVNPQVYIEKYGCAMGAMIDEVMRDGVNMDMIISRAVELAKLRAIEERSGK